MGIETRNGKQYVYRKERRGDRVVSVYVCPAGGIFAGAMAEMTQLLRSARRTEVALGTATGSDLAELDDLMGRVAGEARDLAEAAMHAAGYHRHARGPWRKRRMTVVKLEDDGGPDEIPLDRKERDEFQRRAVGGDESTRKAVRRMIADNPGLIDGLKGDVAKTAEVYLVMWHAGKDIPKQEAIHARLRQVREELAGPDPTPIERLLAERAALCWLAANNAEIEAIRNMGSPLASRFERRCVTAHSRYVSTLKALATVRRLAVPEIRMALDARSVNVTVATPPAIEAPDTTNTTP